MLEANGLDNEHQPTFVCANDEDASALQLLLQRYFSELTKELKHALEKQHDEVLYRIRCPETVPTPSAQTVSVDDCADIEPLFSEDVDEWKERKRDIQDISEDIVEAADEPVSLSRRMNSVGRKSLVFHGGVRTGSKGDADMQMDVRQSKSLNTAGSLETMELPEGEAVQRRDYPSVPSVRSGRMSIRWPKRGSGKELDGVGGAHVCDWQQNAPAEASFCDAKKQYSIFGFKKVLEDSASPLEQEEHDVMNYYDEYGCAQQVARSDWFNSAALLLVFTNAIYVGYAIDHNKAADLTESDFGFQVCENAFCVLFTLEIIIRFMAFKVKRHCFIDAWFKLDSVLVVLMIIETWLVPVVFWVFNLDADRIPTGPMRLMRLLRVSRMSRLFKYMPELQTMIKGMFVATRAVSSALLLLVIMMYVFAIVLVLGLGDAPELDTDFGTMPKCMLTLLVDGIFMDNVGERLDEVMESGYWYMLCPFMLFILLAWMTVMNMLIGILCEVVCAVATAEEEAIAIKALKQTVLSLLLDLDDGSGMIEQNQLVMVLTDEESQSILQGLNIDLEHLFGWLSMVYQISDRLSVRFVMNAIMTARGDRTLTMSDLMEAHAYSRWSVATVIETVEKRLKDDIMSGIERIENDFRRLKGLGPPPRTHKPKAVTFGRTSSPEGGKVLKTITPTADVELCAL